MNENSFLYLFLILSFYYNSALLVSYFILLVYALDIREIPKY